MKTVCIIPSRLNSYRFQRKAMVEILGKPMIQHVYERAVLAPSIKDEVYVATPDREIYDTVISFGGKALMTSENHNRPTSRVYEAAKMTNADLVVMLQGDEPFVHPKMIDIAIEAYKNSTGTVGVNLIKEADYDEAKDLNEVKAVFDLDMNSLFYSREPIPSKWLGDKKFSYYIVVAVFVYPMKTLELFNSLEMTPMENIESIDMLRFLENGYKIKLAISPYITYSVNTPKDIEKAANWMKKDPLWGVY